LGSQNTIPFNAADVKVAKSQRRKTLTLYTEGGDRNENFPTQFIKIEGDKHVNEYTDANFDVGPKRKKKKM